MQKSHFFQTDFLIAIGCRWSLPFQTLLPLSWGMRKVASSCTKNLPNIFKRHLNLLKQKNERNFGVTILRLPGPKFGFPHGWTTNPNWGPISEELWLEMMRWWDASGNENVRGILDNRNLSLNVNLILWIWDVLLPQNQLVLFEKDVVLLNCPVITWD